MNLRRALCLCLVVGIATACVFFARKNKQEVTIRWTEINYLVQDYFSPPSATNLMLGSSSIARLVSEKYLDPACGAWTNRGVGSSTIKDTLRYLRLTKANESMNKVILYLGENDLAKGTDFQTVLARYKTLLQALSEKFKNATVNIVPVKPSLSRMSTWATFQSLNQRIEELSESHEKLVFHNPEWMDVYRSGSDHETHPWFLSDGVHLTHAGYLAFAEPINKACTYQ